jgi:YXWGXW repeat-containing protein
MKCWIARNSLLCGLAVVSLTGCAGGYVGVYATNAPPPIRVETYGPAPGPDFVWITGYWAYRSNAYVWVPGRWDRPPRGRRHWEDGRWEQHGDRYRWRDGRWR